ncbi:MAG: hypothetical protein E7545_02835 [Ruminococcaceae bacterium]|nr:hypothetical protein [Oscillospiraceae bacterium]
MKFLYNNTLNLVTAQGVLLQDMRFWVRGQGGEKNYLNITEANDGVVSYSNENGDITAVLSIACKDNTAALKVDIDYAPKLGTTWGQNHLDTDSAAGIDIASMPESLGYMANFMRCDYWCGTKIFDALKDMPVRTQALLAKQKDGGYAYLLTTCDNYFKSNIIAAEDGGCTVFIYARFPISKCSEHMLIIGLENDPYKLPDITAEYGLKVMKKKGKARKERRYPEVFEYLGWCSWDAFHMDVTHEGLLQKAQEFKDKGIPVRWAIIDDMWAEVHNNNIPTMHSRELYNFEADPVRFPNGLAAAVGDLKEQYGLKVGIWYPTLGYWNGIDPEGPIAREHSDLLTISHNNGRLIPSPRLEKLFQYFNMFNSFFKDCNADFVKVDWQSCILLNYEHLAPVGYIAKNLHTAIEATVGGNFDGNLINCMGMGNENFWNRPLSLVNRISGDFMPEDRKWFVQHLIQCSFNAFTQGSIYTGDWDMWWSDDAQGVKNSVLRAMSGGPVYVSDELGRSIKEKIMPIVYSDGKIIRLKESARPAPECLLNDCEHNGKIFKVFNKTENAGIVAAFNIDEEEKAVSGEISIADVYGMADERCAVVDYFAKTVTVLEKGEKLDLTLNNYDDFRLYYIIPLNEAVVPLGVMDKYMAPATFNIFADKKCVVEEGGKFCFIGEPKNVYVNGEAVKAEKMGDMLYAVNLSCDEKKIILEWGK